MAEKTNDDFVTEVGRMCFANLFKPDEKYEKYGLTLLIPKDDKTAVKAIVNQLKNLVNSDPSVPKKFKRGDETGRLTAAFFSSFGKDCCFRDGDVAADSAEEPEKYEHYRGHYLLIAKNANPVPVVDLCKVGKDGKAFAWTAENGGKKEVYWGRNCRIQLWLFYTENKGSKVIAGYLKNVGLAAGGERIGGDFDADPESAFKDYFKRGAQADDEDDDDEDDKPAPKKPAPKAAKRPVDDDDDEDDKPAPKKPAPKAAKRPVDDDDDEDDKPAPKKPAPKAAKRPVDDDDDEDDKPAPKKPAPKAAKRPVDDDDDEDVPF